MRDFIISTDATCDVPQEIFDKYKIPVVPMPFSLNIPRNNSEKNLKKKVEYDRVDYRSDTDTNSMEEFYNKLENGALQLTGQANSQYTADTLEPYLEKGYDVIHISFSSGMSGTYNSARLAVIDLKEKYPDRKIVAIDSLSGAGGQGLLVTDAYKLKEQGKNFDEIVDYLETNKLRYCHYFIVGDFKFLARSGRISSFQELIGTLLGINIILGLDREGKIFPVAKVRGRKKAVRKMIELLGENMEGDNSEIILSHGNCYNELLNLGEKILGKYSSIKNISYTFVNKLVGANAGPKSLAIFFRGNGRPALK